MTAMQREAGTPENRLKEQAIELVPESNLPALLMLIHNVYTDSIMRRVSPAKTGEAYREVCLLQAR